MTTKESGNPDKRLDKQTVEKQSRPVEEGRVVKVRKGVRIVGRVLGVAGALLNLSSEYEVGTVVTLVGSVVRAAGGAEAVPLWLYLHGTVLAAWRKVRRAVRRARLRVRLGRGRKRG